MKYYFFSTLTFLLLFSCNERQKDPEKHMPVLDNGAYRGVLDVMDNNKLPFLFHVFSKDSLEIYNADEKIMVSEIEYRNDSVYIRMPAFEGYLVAKIQNGKLYGSFVKESLGRTVPFHAEKDKKNRFEPSSDPNNNVSGIWETVFNKGVEGDEYIAKGTFSQDGPKVTGTFRTTTGDYRYLEGIMDGDSLRLSTFDGAHAFLFLARVKDSTMEGAFYSGNHWKEPFEAMRNASYELPNPDELTYLNEGYDTLEFTFPDLNGDEVSLNDDKFKDKVIIVQIMGSWCPNCLDETKYFTDYYKHEKPANVEFVALAFEYAKTEDKAIESLRRLKENVKIPYPILLAQFGSSSKEEAQKKLPMLNHVLSYPTTIFIDKEGKVRKIHTGFNGPATGDKYVEFQKQFTSYVASLATE